MGTTSMSKPFYKNTCGWCVMSQCSAWHIIMDVPQRVMTSCEYRTSGCPSDHWTQKIIKN